jgi:3-hydroxyisobutyrate dehydrogenase/glyoxylate/succinic semialdehyde reductase
VNIGFIGLGLMGSRIANRINNLDNQVYIFNRTKSKGTDLIKNGAVRLDSPDKIGTKCDIVFTMLDSEEAVEILSIGENGFLKNMKKKTTWVDLSSVSPSFSIKLHKAASKTGVQFIDAPVSGSIKPAETGELLLLVGGKEENTRHLTPIFQAISKKIIYTNEVGKGSSLKLVINLMLGHAMASFCEAVSLGVSLDLDSDFLLDILSSLPVTAPYLKSKLNNFKTHNYEPEFQLKDMTKDLHLAEITAYQQGIPFFSTSTVKQMFSVGKQNGLQHQDFSAIYDLLVKEKH